MIALVGIAALAVTAATIYRGTEQHVARAARKDASHVDRATFRAPVLSLHGESLSEPNAFNRPFRLEWGDSSLIVLDRQTEPLIRILDSRTGEGRVNIGDATEPYARGAWVVGPLLSGSDSVYVFDSYKKTLSVMGQAEGDAGRIGRQVSFGLQSRLTEVRPLANGTYVGTGFRPGARYFLFDSLGRTMRGFGIIPGEWSDTLPYEVRQEAFLPTLATNPAGTMVATATQFADRLEIYAQDGRLVALGDRPLGFEPTYVVKRPKRGKPFMAHVTGTRMGYLALAASNEHIYALMSGRTRARDGRRAPLGKTVYVYDWHGRLTQVLDLDRDANAVAVDPTERHLFTLAQIPTPVLVHYALAEGRPDFTNSSSKATQP